MKRIIALLLACILVCSAAGSFAEEGKRTPRVDSYDFDFRIHLEANTYSFHERKLMQGYEELLDEIEVKGNYSYCPETDCMDLHVEIIPVHTPDSAVSFRVYGWVANWLNVSSPLMGDSAVCFRPKEVLNFAMRAYDFFQIPLFHFAILFPKILSNAYIEMAEVWEKKIARMEGSGDVLPVDVMEQIEAELKTKIETHEYVTTLIGAATKPLSNSEDVNEEIRRLPELLLYAADGESLTMERNETDGIKTSRVLNHRGETIYESRREGQTFEEALTLPGSPSDYIPAYAFREEKTENETSFRLNLSWDRTSEDESLPETYLRISAEMAHIPSAFPADAEFSGEASVEGLILPVFHYLVNCVTGADGAVNLSLALPDKPDEPVITCTGTIVPVAYEGELSYMIGEIITDYNLFALSDQSLADLMEDVVPALTEGIPDFFYALPTRGVQSLLDTLEKYGLLQVTLQ